MSSPARRFSPISRCCCSPAISMLIVVLCATLVLGWLWMLPAAYAELGSDVFASAAFFANIALLLQSGYFDVDRRTLRNAGAGLAVDAAGGVRGAGQRCLRQRGVFRQYRAAAAVRLFRC